MNCGRCGMRKRERKVSEGRWENGFRDGVGRKVRVPTVHMGAGVDDETRKSTRRL